MKNVQYEIVSEGGVGEACRAVLTSGGHGSMLVVISFTGDRVSCCDEAVVAKEGERIVGVATLASSGEMGSGQPTLVGIWVDPAFTRRGIGQHLVGAVVKRVEERRLALPVRVDAAGSELAAWFCRLPWVDRLDIHAF